MRKTLVLAMIAAACAGLASNSVLATTVFKEKFVCPIGGEKFEANVIGSSSSFGQRPDGRSYGTLPIYPIIECPGNGFLLIQEEFAENEITILTETVASAEYQAMRTAETQNYRAWWLEKAVGNDPYNLAGALLRAAWETDHDPARKARYQTAFVDAATNLDPAASNDEDWFWLNLRAANAMRELARFPEAAALLDKINRPGILPTDPESLAGARALIDGQRLLLADSNTASEPTNLIPPGEARFRCVIDREKLTPAEVQACAKPDVREEIADTEIKTKDGRDLAGEDAIRYIVDTNWNQPEH